VVDGPAERPEVGGAGGRRVGHHSFHGRERADVPECDCSQLGLVGGEDGAGALRGRPVTVMPLGIRTLVAGLLRVLPTKSTRATSFTRF
jgi:hypothetical protein